MLYTQGNDLTRLQCGFIDTDEIEKITELIGAQMGYSDSYILPEYIEEDNNQNNTINIEERDSLFKDASLNSESLSSIFMVLFWLLSSSIYSGKIYESE